MPEKVTYYAIVDSYSSRRHPAGVLRRTETDDGRRDEAFGRNLAWGPRDGTGFRGGELHEITEEEAGLIVRRMRLEAASQALRRDHRSSASGSPVTPGHAAFRAFRTSTLIVREYLGSGGAGRAR